MPNYVWQKGEIMSKRFGRFMADVMGGTFLSKDSVIQFFPFILYVVFLLMLNITNTYVAEDMSRELAKLERQVEELHVEYIYLRSEVTKLTKQSNLAKMLEDRGIKESVDPLKKIVITNDKEENYGF